MPKACQFRSPLQSPPALHRQTTSLPARFAILTATSLAPFSLSPTSSNCMPVCGNMSASSPACSSSLLSSRCSSQPDFNGSFPNRSLIFPLQHAPFPTKRITPCAPINRATTKWACSLTRLTKCSRKSKNAIRSCRRRALPPNGPIKPRAISFRSESRVARRSCHHRLQRAIDSRGGSRGPLRTGWTTCAASRLR